MAVSKKEKIKEIYEVLPKLNCGFCGFGSCGQFARAVAEGRASPFGCRQNPWLGYRICEIIGAKVPAYSYGFQPAFTPKTGAISSAATLKALGEEVRELSREADAILARLDKIGQRR
jgi:Na+-translocating ferredoxin:NAD+ oxidoreductase RNF subunit RnfB